MTTLTDTLRLAEFTADHLPGAVRLSQQAQWPHRTQDWALTLSQSQGVVAIENDQVVGTALASLFGDVATLNMIIVDEALRGRKLGRKLMNAVIQIAGTCEMRLIATADGLPLYEKLGFKAIGEIQQFQGDAQAVAPEIPVEIGECDLDRLIEMDHAASGLERGDLLARIASVGTVFHCESGFAILRAFGRGQVLGPIVAADDRSARSLLAAAASHAMGGFLRIDTPSPELGEFVKTLGMAHVGGGTCMVLNPLSKAPDTKIRTFGLISQALG
ncbi:MAG: GNAT family N-acetyltransferase [Thalassovita sp.]